jgi:hypothetical protein
VRASRTDEERAFVVENAMCCVLRADRALKRSSSGPRRFASAERITERQKPPW